ncbi:hypothetical protein EJ08DRAFT_707452 [Tothia fuscella]|uniref:YDG domain-containing protein n=1 Tax=Tothia fuscella TaxID=1048955 RepID=A0A9P4NET0_9PEZI|nr:hypothetical protein EJ08DRAFT_707452 [Tothia fuscella]
MAPRNSHKPRPLSRPEVEISSKDSDTPPEFSPKAIASSGTKWGQLTWKERDIPESLKPEALRCAAAWIRDDLDPLVAREGPKALGQDEIISIHTLLILMQQHQIPLHTLRFSRIHLAIDELRGKATRWPKMLVMEADCVVEYLVSTYGPLKHIRTPLYEKGGRLSGVCLPGDITKQALINRFRQQNPELVDNTRAYVHGNAKFTAGQWWLNTIFAFRDGIIDNKCNNGGICYDEKSCYAIVLTGKNEVESMSPETFTYRCGPEEPGRHRLVARTFRARYPIRVLRSHNLASINAPRAGVRYEGLYKVVGWALRPYNTSENDKLQALYDVKFERDDPFPVDRLMRIPLAEDVDDYKAFKLSLRERLAEEDSRQSSELLDDVRRKCVIDVELPKVQDAPVVFRPRLERPTQDTRNSSQLLDDVRRKDVIDVEIPKDDRAHEVSPTRPQRPTLTSSKFMASHSPKNSDVAEDR